MIEQAKLANDADQVDIVAHSMGGLVAREYIQSDYYDNDVDQLVVLGTPNEGASDAYVAWEGGRMPVRWGAGTRMYINLVDFALRHNRDQKDLEPPLSFRAFFPSLKDLIPVNSFITRDGNPVTPSGLTVQNTFLQNLQDTIGLIAERSVGVTTIAGNNLNTLNSVPLNSERTPDDDELQRWRDGHPNPDPPQTDTATGDQTVLLSSAHFGSNNITLEDINHVKLPEEAQEEVLTALGKNLAGTHIAYDLPDSLIGTVIMSPIDPIITGPGGEILSADDNTFSDAEFVNDPDDPNGPKLLVIANPLAGDYSIELNGTDSGEFAVFTTYTDEDETISITEEGSTVLGQQDIINFTITEETFVIEPDAPTLSLLELTAQLREITHHKNKNHFHRNRMKHHNKLHGQANKLHSYTQKYVKHLDEYGTDHKKTLKNRSKIQKSFDEFMKELNKLIDKNRVDETIVSQIIDITDQIELHLET
jgi:hypothetical protein